MSDAEKHGNRFIGARDVAIADGSTCFVRRHLLDLWIHKICVDSSPSHPHRDMFYPMQGFPLHLPVGYYMWMENLCCHVRRSGFRIRMVGVNFTHLGGRTSAMHGVVQSDYQAEHKYFYEQNRDVLPYRVPE
jgi:hypothetical protein